MKSKLRKARERLGLSLRDVAKETGVSHPVIGRIELGTHTPSQQQARALHQFYDGIIPIAEIYDPFFNQNQEAHHDRQAEHDRTEPQG